MPDTGTRADRAAERLESLTEELLAEVQTLPAALITWVPGEGVWSVMDILCHVEEFIPYWTEVVLQVVRHPDQPWGRNHADARRLAAVDHTAARQLSEVDRAIRMRARESAAALRHLTDADLANEAPSRNPRWGVKPAGFILDDLLVQHVQKHIGQVRRNIQQYRERPS